MGIDLVGPIILSELGAPSSLNEITISMSLLYLPSHL